MVDLSNLRGNLSGYYKAKDNSTKTQKLQESAADATKMLKEMDTDKDGVVSQKELAKELSKAENFKGTQYKATLAMADLAAKKIDKDNNGISEVELMSYVLYEDSTQKESGDKSRNSAFVNIDGSVDDFGKYVALRNLNYTREDAVCKTANANFDSIESTMQSFISQKAPTAPTTAPSSTSATTSSSTSTSGHSVGNSYHGEAPATTPTPTPTTPTPSTTSTSSASTSGGHMVGNSYRGEAPSYETTPPTPPTPPTSGTTSTSNVVNKSMQSREAQAEIKPQLSKISYYNAMLKTAKTQEETDKWQSKIDDAKQKILNIELKYAGVTGPTADSQAAVNTRLAEISKELSAAASEISTLDQPLKSGATQYETMQYYSASKTNTMKSQELKDKCTLLKAEEDQLKATSGPTLLSSADKSAMNKRLAQISQESSLVEAQLAALKPPTLGSNATIVEQKMYSIDQRVYSLRFTPLDYQRKMLKAEEADIQARLIADAKAEATTAINTRLVELAEEFTKYYSDITSLVLPTYSSINPTKTERNQNAVGNREYNAQYNDLTEAKNVLVAEETKLRTQLAQLNKS